MSAAPHHALPSRELYGGGAGDRPAGRGAGAWASRALDVFDRACVRAVAHGLSGVPMRIAFRDGASAAASTAAPVATVRVHDRRTLVRLVASPDLGFGEGYMDGRLEVDGDLAGLLEGITRRWLLRQPTERPVDALRRWWSGNPMPRARRNARRHYDLGNEFYRQWLDEDMVYTCAYFAEPGMTLEAAQRAKHELIARKLHLRPGETVYEAGGGWGSLALYLARHHGVRVRAWNVSHEQVVWARARAARDGLADRVEIIEDDYRHIDGTCDAFVSVGMLEHVGRRDHAVLGSVIDRALHPTHGRGLLHFIGRNTPAATSAWIDRYIFPGAYMPSLRESLGGVLEPHGFSVLDVENLRRHYAATLAEWLARFEGAADAVRARFGDRFVRMWRLYLAEAEAGFRAGSLQLFQVTFARPMNDDMPMTRAHLYRD